MKTSAFVAFALGVSRTTGPARRGARILRVRETRECVMEFISDLGTNQIYKKLPAETAMSSRKSI
jgi:hypothetical protein